MRNCSTGVSSSNDQKILYQEALLKFKFHVLLFHSDEYKFAKESVERMVWLDCGHSGSGKGTYVNDGEVLKRLVELDIKVDVRATPYQVHYL